MSAPALAPPALAALAVLAVVVLVLGVAIRGARRRRRLNAALHELRRPLQSIALALEGTHPDAGCARACLAQARAALTDLDALINGRERVVVPALVQIGDLAAALERRWRFAGIEVRAPRAAGRLIGDPARIGAALDNLVANALQHGSGPVRVLAAERAGEARFEVRDRGAEDRRAAANSASVKVQVSGKAAGPGPRHGHGLGVVGAVAAVHGGRALPPRRTADGGTLAALALPSRPESR